jgi:hypothetical protein
MDQKFGKRTTVLRLEIAVYEVTTEKQLIYRDKRRDQENQK